jgi:hypothetical protein
MVDRKISADSIGGGRRSDLTVSLAAVKGVISRNFGFTDQPLKISPFRFSIFHFPEVFFIIPIRPFPT